MMTGSNMLRAIAMVGLLTLLLISCNDDPQAETTSQAADSAHTTVELPVTGMTCGTCEAAISGQLLKQDGVVGVTASHVDQQVIVKYDPGVMDEAEIISNIEILGFDVVDRGITLGSEEQDQPTEE